MPSSFRSMGIGELRDRSRSERLAVARAEAFIAKIERRIAYLSAQVIETQRAKTEGLGPQDESAVAKPCAQGDAA